MNSIHTRCTSPHNLRQQRPPDINSQLRVPTRAPTRQRPQHPEYLRSRLRSASCHASGTGGSVAVGGGGCTLSTMPHNSQSSTSETSNIHDDRQSVSGANTSSSSQAGPALPAAVDSLPPARLKQLRRDGLALKDSIKLGRRGVAEGLISQIQRRWNTVEVARLYCHGKHAANMKVLVQQLEQATGGVVVHKAGGTVLLYRGDHWQPSQQHQDPTQQQQQQQQEASASEGQGSQPFDV